MTAAERLLDAGYEDVVIPYKIYNYLPTIDGAKLRKFIG